MRRGESEKGLRASLKSQLGSSVFWIEAGAGGTLGLTDAVVSLGGAVLFIELKVARLGRLGWSFAATTSQPAAWRRMSASGLRVGVLARLVGVAGRPCVGLLRVEAGHNPMDPNNPWSITASPSGRLTVVVRAWWVVGEEAEGLRDVLGKL